MSKFSTYPGLPHAANAFKDAEEIWTKEEFLRHIAAALQFAYEHGVVMGAITPSLSDAIMDRRRSKGS